MNLTIWLVAILTLQVSAATNEKKNKKSAAIIKQIKEPKKKEILPQPPTCTLVGPTEPLPPGGGEVVLKVIAHGQAQAVSAMKVTVTETTTVSTSVEGPGGVGKCSAKIEVTPLPDLSDIQ